MAWSLNDRAQMVSNLGKRAGGEAIHLLQTSFDQIVFELGDLIPQQDSHNWNSSGRAVLFSPFPFTIIAQDFLRLVTPGATCIPGLWLKRRYENKS